MHIYQKIYEFAASAGAFEGYVYHKEKTDIDMDALANWADNLLGAYTHLPPDILNEFQSCLDQTIGRAVISLETFLDEEHVIVQKLKSIIAGELPESEDDFNRLKWFQK